MSLQFAVNGLREKKIGSGKISGSASATAFGAADKTKVIHFTVRDSTLTSFLFRLRFRFKMYAQRPLSYAPTPYSYTPNPARSASINLDEVRWH
jgi:hypothetical protein